MQNYFALHLRPIAIGVAAKIAADGRDLFFCAAFARNTIVAKTPYNIGLFAISPKRARGVRTHARDAVLRATIASSCTRVASFAGRVYAPLSRVAVFFIALV